MYDFGILSIVTMGRVFGLSDKESYDFFCVNFTQIFFQQTEPRFSDLIRTCIRMDQTDHETLFKIYQIQYKKKKWVASNTLHLDTIRTHPYAQKCTRTPYIRKDTLLWYTIQVG